MPFAFLWTWLHWPIFGSRATCMTSVAFNRWITLPVPASRISLSLPLLDSTSSDGANLLCLGHGLGLWWKRWPVFDRRCSAVLKLGLDCFYCRKFMESVLLLFFWWCMQCGFETWLAFVGWIFLRAWRQPCGWNCKSVITLEAFLPSIGLCPYGPWIAIQLKT